MQCNPKQDKYHCHRLVIHLCFSVRQSHLVPLGRLPPCPSLSFSISKMVVTFLGQVVPETQVRFSRVIIAIMLNTLSSPGSDQRVLPNIWVHGDRSRTQTHLPAVENPLAESWGRAVWVADLKGPASSMCPLCRHRSRLSVVG